MLGYVLGVGKTRFGPSSHQMTVLAHQAISEALEDAGIDAHDIKAIIVANFLGGPNEGQLHLNSVVAGLLPGVNVPSWRVEAACASGGAALHNALLALHAYDPILVVGMERLSNVGGGTLTRNIGMAGDVLLDQSVGLTFPANYALVAQRHMIDYGTEVRDLELVSLKNHQNARLNPKAHFHHKNVTQADIDGGPTVATPLRLFDCCPVSDGAAAVVISRSPNDRSIAVLGSAVSSDVISLAQRDELTSFKAARLAAADSYRQAGIAASDVGFAEVHDCFTIAEVVAMEDLGLCAPGQAAQLIRGGETGRQGRIPVNPSGGLKAGGHAIGATGIGQVYEVAQQMRGTAGERQIARTDIAVTHNVGGVGGTCAVHVFGRAK